MKNIIRKHLNEARLRRKTHPKKGDRVNVDPAVVYDETKGKTDITTGTVMSPRDSEDVVYGPEDLNYYYRVVLDDGTEISVNSYEITPLIEARLRGEPKQLKTIKIVKLTYPTDNSGGEEIITDPIGIYNNLTNPDYFDDDTTYYCKKGRRYFIDDLIGKFVQVGNSIFVVEE